MKRRSARSRRTLLGQPITLKFREHACEPVGNTPAQVRAFVNAESERWKKAIQITNIKL